MSNTIKQLKDAQGNAFDPQTSIEALTSTGGGGGKFLTTNDLGGGSFNVTLTEIQQNGTPVYPSSGVLNLESDIQGANATTLAAGSSATATIDSNKTLQLGIPCGADGANGQDAYNPFKGSYVISDTLPTIGQTGDYIYVVDTQTPPVTHLYAWNGTAFVDSGETVTMGDSQFANSTKPISQTNVVNDLTTGGVDDVLSAEQGVVLAGQVSQLDLKVTELVVVKRTGYDNVNKFWKINYTVDANKTYRICRIGGDNGTIIRGSQSGEVLTLNVWTSFTPTTSGLLSVYSNPSTANPPVLLIALDDSGEYANVAKVESEIAGLNTATLELSDEFYGERIAVGIDVVTGTASESNNNIYNSTAIPSGTIVKLKVVNASSFLSQIRLRAVQGGVNKTILDYTSFTDGQEFLIELKQDTPKIGLYVEAAKVIGTGTVQLEFTPDYGNSVKALSNEIPSIKRTSISNDIYKVNQSRGKNLFDNSDVTVGGYLNSTGGISVSSSYRYSGYIEIKPSTYYTQSPVVPYTCAHLYDADLKYISYVSAPGTFQTPANGKYIRISTSNGDAGNTQLEEGQSATSYEEFNPIKGYLDGQETKETEKVYITCKRNGVSGVDADFCGLNAIGDAVNSITDASSTKQYYIIVDGHFLFTNPKMVSDGGDFKYEEGGEPTPVISKKYVHFVGIDKGKAIVEVNLDGGLASSDFPSDKTFTDYQPLYIRESCSVENMTFIGTNVRYTVHIEKNNVDFGCDIHLKNCSIISKVSTQGYKAAMVIGAIPYFNLLVEDCDFVNENQTTLFGGHSPLDYISNGRENCNIVFDGCSFKTEGEIGLDLYHYNRQDLMVFKNCHFCPTVSLVNNAQDDRKVPIGNRTEQRHSGEPMPYCIKRAASAYGLRVSTITGTGTSVRFDPTSSAFSIVGNANEDTMQELPYSAIKSYGYEYKDDANGSHAYACGWVNIAPTTGNSLGSILGDCSGTSKTLIITINGTDYDVVFNTNLTSESNDNIITLINAVIGEVAICDTFNPDIKQYPDFSEEEFGLVNGDSELIEAGMGVVKTSVSTIRRAKHTDGRIDGIAIDSFYPGQKGRIIRKGKLYNRSDTTLIHYFNINPVLGTMAYNTLISIDPANDGKFVASSDAPVLRYVGNGVVEII